MKTSEIKARAEKYMDEWAVVGIRTQDEEFILGEIEHKSHIWYDDNMTDMQHNGISCSDAADINAVRMHADDYDPRKGYYYGEHMAIIVGTEYYMGQDEGEVVICNQIVVEILR